VREEKQALFGKKLEGISKKKIGMDFQRMDQKANAGRFERGYLKVTTENLANWNWSRSEKPPKTFF